MKIAATVTVCHQIGIETWIDDHITKVFEETSTIIEIVTWAKTIDKIATFSQIRFSVIAD